MSLDKSVLLEAFELIDGVLHWRHVRDSFGRWNKRFAGKPVRFNPTTRGYLQVRVMRDGKHHYFQAHRVIWLIATGDWPRHVIDHINHDRSDNRLSNLRDIPFGLNVAHRRVRSKGYSWSRRQKRWQARISVDGKKLHLGSFKSEADARAARQAAERRYRPELFAHDPRNHPITHRSDSESAVCVSPFHATPFASGDQHGRS